MRLEALTHQRSLNRGPVDSLHLLSWRVHRSRGYCERGRKEERQRWREEERREH